MTHHLKHLRRAAERDRQIRERNSDVPASFQVGEDGTSGDSDPGRRKPTGSNSPTEAIRKD